MSWVDWDAMWRVLVLGLSFGVGAVALFSLAIVGLDSADGTAGGGRLRGRLLAGVCLLACAAAIVTGLWVMLDK